MKLIGTARSKVLPDTASYLIPLPISLRAAMGLADQTVLFATPAGPNAFVASRLPPNARSSTYSASLEFWDEPGALRTLVDAITATGARVVQASTDAMGSRVRLAITLDLSEAMADAHEVAGILRNMAKGSSTPTLVKQVNVFSTGQEGTPIRLQGADMQVPAHLVNSLRPPSVVRDSVGFLVSLDTANELLRFNLAHDVTQVKIGYSSAADGTKSVSLLSQVFKDLPAENRPIEILHLAQALQSASDPQRGEIDVVVAASEAALDPWLQRVRRLPGVRFVEAEVQKDRSKQPDTDDVWALLQANVGPPAAPDLALDIDPGRASPETLTALLCALSELQRAAGGLGLEFRVRGSRVAVREMAAS